jgi:hypothetical protein
MYAHLSVLNVLNVSFSPSLHNSYYIYIKNSFEKSLHVSDNLQTHVDSGGRKRTFPVAAKVREFRDEKRFNETTRGQHHQAAGRYTGGWAVSEQSASVFDPDGVWVCAPLERPVA